MRPRADSPLADPETRRFFTCRRTSDSTRSTTSITGFARPKRKELFAPLGVTGRLFTDTAKSNRVALVLEVPDLEAFQELLQSEAGADAMRFDGVRPETLVIFEQASEDV